MLDEKENHGALFESKFLQVVHATNYLQPGASCSAACSALMSASFAWKLAMVAILVKLLMPLMLEANASQFSLATIKRVIDKEQPEDVIGND